MLPSSRSSSRQGLCACWPARQCAACSWAPPHNCKPPTCPCAHAADKGVMMHPIMGALRHSYGGPWEVRRCALLPGNRRAALGGDVRSRAGSVAHRGCGWLAACCSQLLSAVLACCLLLGAQCPNRHVHAALQSDPSRLQMLQHLLPSIPPPPLSFLLPTRPTAHATTPPPSHPPPPPRSSAAWSWALARRSTSPSAALRRSPSRRRSPTPSGRPGPRQPLAEHGRAACCAVLPGGP